MAAAMAVVLLVTSSFYVGQARLKGEVLGARAISQQRQQGLALVARDLFREAVTVYPSNPVLRVSLARAMVKSENDKALSADARTRGLPPEQRAEILLQTIDVDRMRQAEELLRGIEGGYARPAFLELNRAETNNMIAILMANLNRRQETIRFGQRALDGYKAYRAILGHPVDESRAFYEPAIRRSYELENFRYAVTFGEDFQFYFPGEWQKSEGILDDVINRARARQGELPMANQALATALLKNPSDGRTIGEMISLARESGDPRAILWVFNIMQRRRVWSPELERYQSELAGLLVKFRHERIYGKP